MECLITIKVQQEMALQTIKDLQALGLDPVHFDVGSKFVPLSKPVKKGRTTRWVADVKVRVVKVRSKAHGGATVLKSLGMGWEGSYKDVYEECKKSLPVGTPDSAVRALRASLKNTGALERVL